MYRFHLAAASAALLTLAAALSAQPMAGTYTVDPNTGTFATISAAANALAGKGVSGAVEIVVSPGTYSESIMIAPINGTSATNTVTFRSAVPTVNALKARLTAPSGDVITIQSDVHYVTLNGFSFQNVTNAAAINLLYLSNRSTNITIQNCFFDNTVVPHTSFGAIRTRSVQSWNLLNNEFHQKGTALHSQSSVSMTVANNTFDIQNAPHCLSLYNTNQSRSTIYNNVFTGTVTTACMQVNVSQYGIDIFHNTFNLTLPSSKAYIFDNGACCSAWNRFFNNIYVVRGGGKVYSHDRNEAIELNNNIYFVQSGVIGDYNNVDYNTLASWSAALGAQAQNGNNDGNSLVGDPMFAPSSSWELSATSPAIGAALPVPPTWTSGFQVVDDISGWMRGSKKDIGAHEIAGCKIYGEGCAGTGNMVPLLECSGNVAPGDTVNLDVTNAKASSQVFVAFGLQKLNFSFGSGCNLLTNAIILFSAGTTAQGTFSLPAAIPASVSITGAILNSQVGVVDPAAAGIGVAFSNGIELKL